MKHSSLRYKIECEYTLGDWAECVDNDRALTLNSALKKAVAMQRKLWASANRLRESGRGELLQGGPVTIVDEKTGYYWCFASIVLGKIAIFNGHECGGRTLRVCALKRRTNQ